jgi:hypothetical protein
MIIFSPFALLSGSLFAQRLDGHCLVRTHTVGHEHRAKASIIVVRRVSYCAHWKHVDQTVIFADHLLVALPEGYPPVRQRVIKLKQLGGEAFIEFNRPDFPHLCSAFIAAGR